MNPEARFRAWMSGLLTLAAACFVYFLIADVQMPVSPEARLIHRVTQVAPEVGGRVVEVHVRNNQRVRAGDLLFLVDPDTYLTALHDAELQVEQAAQDNAQLEAAVDAAAAEVRRTQAQLEDTERELVRFRELRDGRYVSRSALDQAGARRDVAQAQSQAAWSALAAARAQRGSHGDRNLRLRRARNVLSNARLNLERSRVVAREAGIVSNMRLETGAYAQAGVPKLALVGATPGVHADFREKALLKIAPGTLAEIAFDALPGQVFRAEVATLDAGVSRGQIDPDGRLASPEANDRWVRDAERVRVNLRLIDMPPRALMTGARATVQLHPHAEGIRYRLGQLQIRAISLLHYVY